MAATAAAVNDCVAGRVSTAAVFVTRTLVFTSAAAAAAAAAVGSSGAAAAAAAAVLAKPARQLRRLPRL
eukprot:CAMPEP_0174760242 /NCGR_PEP_ID=MMETSP1094-20130205/108675_1 /TAXON_ID=156173 /ORGANISM="Chrysochromulina brevifilum, Strain UTEX LB 985" /LENGTH=68 /DNA_ID=CAMNT_0015966183 /DNA_START=1439 /DNA_END=1641 /DNA_ORIENTATION=-